jgi:alpha-1,2-mannosyltransferase
VRLGDGLAGLALTGVIGCLVSPVTWVHHLVWLLPAMLLLAARGLQATGRRRAGLLIMLGGLYLLLSSRLVWAFTDHFTGWGVLGGNAYVYASVLLLVALPIESAEQPGIPDHGQLDDAAVRALDGVSGPGAVGEKTGVVVEEPGGLVRFEHP